MVVEAWVGEGEGQSQSRSQNQSKLGGKIHLMDLEHGDPVGTEPS